MATLQALTPQVKARLDELTATLTGSLGRNLVGLVVHGSAVRGGWRQGSSDVDLVCVLDDASQSVLESIGPALELARFSARIETMTETHAEIARSPDCFPLLYADLTRTSVTLDGTNPFSALQVPTHHKWLRIEQELREIRIRMRRVVTDMAGQASFAGAIERKLKQLRAPPWALFELRGDKVDDGLDSVLAAAATTYDVDVAPLRRVREAPKP